jgi:hypothetical protein
MTKGYLIHDSMNATGQTALKETLSLLFESSNPRGYTRAGPVTNLLSRESSPDGPAYLDSVRSWSIRHSPAQVI